MSVLLSRLLGMALVIAALPLGLAACSGGTDDTTLPRSQKPSRLPPSSAGTKSTDDAPPAATPPPSTPEQAPAPDAGASPAPVPTPLPTPPAPGSCGAPKCFALAGVGGCKATDSAGDLVTMGCQDGACACLAAGQTTTTFDGDANSADDARSRFLTNCACN